MSASRIEPIIIYGPQGCGKTRHAEAFRAFFRGARVVDEWIWGDPLEPGDVALTHIPCPAALPQGTRVFAYEDVVGPVMRAA